MAIPTCSDRTVTDEENWLATSLPRSASTVPNTRKAPDGSLWPISVAKANLQVKLQQAQFLARLYSDKATELTGTDEDM